MANDTKTHLASTHGRVSGTLTWQTRRRVRAKEKRAEPRFWWRVFKEEDGSKLISTKDRQEAKTHERTYLGRRYLRASQDRLARDRDLLRRHRRGRAGRLASRQPHLFLPLAQRHPARRRGGSSLPGAGPRRDGRLRCSPRRLLPLRGPRPVHRRLVRSAWADKREAGGTRLGLGPRVLLGAQAPRAGARDRLHGGPGPADDLGGVARRCAPVLPGPALGSGRGDGAREEPLRRGHPALARLTRSHRRRDERLPQTIPRAR